MSKNNETSKDTFLLTEMCSRGNATVTIADDVKESSDLLCHTEDEGGDHKIDIKYSYGKFEIFYV